MDDKEIGRVWAKYYPKSRDNRDALQTCGSICRVIREKTRLGLSSNIASRLQPVLDACDVPKGEFDEIEKGLFKVGASLGVKPRPA